MPIRPENKARYPADWKAISRAVRIDAKNRCEQCGVMNGAIIYRGFHLDKPAWRYAADTVFMPSRCAISGSELPGTTWDDFERTKETVVVLTVAHLDHQPENCARANLRAWCQRCHNAYDAPMRARGIKERAKQIKAVGDMFEQDAP